MSNAMVRLAKQVESQQPVEVAQVINYQPECGVQRLLPSNTPDFM
jgi:hypothetical protein